MSDDIIKRLREAIAAGPTLDRHGWPQWKQLENLASAGNIRLLLDRLDKAERENERLHESIGMAYGYLWCVNNEPGTPHQYPPERAAYEARKLLRETMTSEQRGTFINRAVALVRGKRPMPPPSTAIDAALAAERGKE